VTDCSPPPRWKLLVWQWEHRYPSGQVHRMGWTLTRRGALREQARAHDPKDYTA
jgi:hypothetical protein